MAKGLSHIFSEASGSVGGLTYQKSSYGAIVLRTRAYPPHPQTLKANRFKSYVTDANSIWVNNLSDSDRNQWKAWSDVVLYSSEAGSRKLTSHQWFVMTYAIYAWIKKRFNLPYVLPLLPTNRIGMLSFPRVIVLKHPFTPNAIRVICYNRNNFTTRVYGVLSDPIKPGCAVSTARWTQNLVATTNVVAGTMNTMTFSPVNTDLSYVVKLRAMVFTAGTTRSHISSLYKFIYIP